MATSTLKFRNLAEYIRYRENYRHELLCKREIAHVFGEYVVLKEGTPDERDISLEQLLMCDVRELMRYKINKIQNRAIKKTPHGSCVSIYIYCRYCADSRRGF